MRVEEEILVEEGEYVWHESWKGAIWGREKTNKGAARDGGGQWGKEPGKTEAAAVWMEMQKERIALPAELKFRLQKLR